MRSRTMTWPGTAGDNEDAVAIDPAGRAAVLIDGAGLPAQLRGGCTHSVRWYARTLAAALLDRLVQGPTTTPAEALRGAIAQVLASHGPGCRPQDGSPSATVAAWRIVGDEVEYAVLADSSLFVRRRDGSVREITDDRLDEVVTPLRTAEVARLLAAGWAAGEARVEAHRRTSEKLRNVPGGFWCAHVDPAAAEEALTGSLPLADVDALVLASDGATRLVHPFGVLDGAAFVAAALDEDPDALERRLRAADVAGEAITREALIKLHDDATIVATPL